MEFHNCNSVIDLYGFKPHLFINGYYKKGTAIGIIFSLITWISMIAITVYYCNKLFINKELTTLSSVRSATSSDYIYMNKDNFIFAYALEDPRYNLYVDEEIYYTEVFYKHGVRNSKGQFDYSDATQLFPERCSKSHFGDQFQDLIKNFPFNNMYCIKNLNYNLTGSFAADEYSFIVLNIYPCKNDTNKKCKTKEELDYFLDGAFFTFQYQNFIFDPNDFEEPFKPKIGDFMTTISKKYYKNLYVYLKKQLLTTDTGLIFESKNENHMTLYDYGSDMMSFQTSSSNFMQLTFRMSLEVTEVSRSYTKAQTIISYIGGFITFLQTIFSLLTDLLTNNFIYEKVINKIFFFKKNDETIVKMNMLKKFNLPTLQYSQNRSSFKNYVSSKDIRDNLSLNDKSASINLNNLNNDDISIINNHKSPKNLISSDILLNNNNKNKNSTLLKLQNNNQNQSSNNKLVKNKTFSISNMDKSKNNLSITKENLVSNNEINNYKIYSNINIIKKNFFNKGKQKQRKKLINSYFKRLFYTCFKKEPGINLFYKGVTIIKQKLDIISIIKDSFHIELIKNILFGKEHVILLDNFIKNEIMEYKVEKYKFDIDKDIIVDDNIINSFEHILNRNISNDYKNEEYMNNNIKKLDKICIEAVIRQNKY